MMRRMNPLPMSLAALRKELQAMIMARMNPLSMQLCGIRIFISKNIEHLRL